MRIKVSDSMLCLLDSNFGQISSYARIGRHEIGVLGRSRWVASLLLCLSLHTQLDTQAEGFSKGLESYSKIK